MRLDEIINIRKGIGILTGFYVIFILLMSWFYPYSFFSIHKSYSWETYEIYSNGKSYKDLLYEFKAIHEKDLRADIENESLPNMTINKTVGLLDFFQNDWLLNDETTPMNGTQLSNIQFELQSAKQTLSDLLVQVDFSSEGKDYLVHMINQIDRMEKKLSELRHDNYYSRNDLRRQFNNLYGEVVFLLDFYITFYENVKNGDFYVEVG